MGNGVRSSTLDLVPVADEFLVNREGKTARLLLANLSAMLSADLNIGADRVAAEQAVTDAQAAKLLAEAARDSAQVNANAYADIATGLAATSEGGQFQVAEGAEIVRYEHSAGAVAAELLRFPTTLGFNIAVSKARRQFEFDAELWFRPAFLTQNFSVEPAARTVKFSFETSATDGQMHMVILPSGAEEPGRAEIAAGTDGLGVAAFYAASLDVGSLDVLVALPRILADATDYDMYVVHMNASGQAGLRHKASFTTPLIQAMGATDGTLDDLSVVNSNTVAHEYQLDANGGVNGIRIIDIGNSSVGTVGLRPSVTLSDGMNAVRLKFKKEGGSFDRLLIAMGSYSVNARAEIAVATGGVVDNSFNSLTVTPLDDGWLEVDAFYDATGLADLSGFVEIYLRQGGSSAVSRDGTQELRVHDFFVEG